MSYLDKIASLLDDAISQLNSPPPKDYTIYYRIGAAEQQIKVAKLLLDEMRRNPSLARRAKRSA